MQELPGNDKLQKYRLFYTGDYQLTKDEEDYLARYEDIQDKLTDDDYTRSDVVKYVMKRYGVTKQMANRTVNEAADLYGSMVEIHRKAARSFQIEKLQRAASLCLNPGTDPETGADLPPDLSNYEKIMNQINKLQNLYEPDPEETDDPAAYEVPTTFIYQAVEDVEYEEVKPGDSNDSGQSSTKAISSGSSAQ